MNRAKILVLVLLVSIDAQFTENPPEIQSGCSGETIYFNWTYAISSPIFVVEWKVDGSRIAIESVATSQPFTPVAGYVGRLSKISNAQISLGPLTIADTGTYKAEVIYTNGNTADSNRTTLTVHDALNNKTEIVETSGILSPSFYDPSITYTWRSPDNVISTGQYLPVSISGNYTLCVSEGKASCLNSAIDPCASKYVEKVNGLTTPSSTFSSDMPSTVSEPSSTIGSDMPTTVSEVPPPPVTTLSSGLSQEIVITIIISSILAVGVLILLIVLVVKQCRQKKRENPSKNKENLFATKQGNFTKKDALKSSIEPRKSKFSGKRNTKQESILLDKFKLTQFNNSEVPKEKMYEHYPQTTDYMYLNNSGNQHVFNHSRAERNMILYGNRHDSYPKPQSRPNLRMLYQSRYPEHPGHNEGMFQYYRADNLCQGQQMYQRPYVVPCDHHIKDKPRNQRSFEGRAYERNWDFLY